MNLTLEYLYGRAVEVGECLEWGGPMQHGSPIVSIGRNGGKNHQYRTVRRVIAEIEAGAPLSSRIRCVADCGNERCILAGHIAKKTYKQVAAMNKAKGLQSSSHARAAIARGRRNRGDVKLSIEIAREIRASDESGPKLASVYGVNRTLIGAIRRGEVWRENVPGASVFNWRPAA